VPTRNINYDIGYEGYPIATLVSKVNSINRGRYQYSTDWKYIVGLITFINIGLLLPLSISTLLYFLVVTYDLGYITEYIYSSG